MGAAIIEGWGGGACLIFPKSWPDMIIFQIHQHKLFIDLLLVFVTSLTNSNNVQIHPLLSKLLVQKNGGGGLILSFGR